MEQDILSLHLGFSRGLSARRTSAGKASSPGAAPEELTGGESTSKESSTGTSVTT